MQERLDTIANVRDAGLSVCCGGILGLGEAAHDRVGLLHVLATLPSHPESVPINALVSVEGTPLAEKGDIDQVRRHNSMFIYNLCLFITWRAPLLPCAGRPRSFACL